MKLRDNKRPWRDKDNLIKASKNKEAKQKEALQDAHDEDDFAALKTNKRDRRTIEDIQRRGGNKRGRVD